MKTYQIKQNAVSLVEVNIPTCGPNQVLVKMKALALNHRDHLVVNGITRWKLKEDGRVPVADGAGEIVAIGDAVTELALGDRVSSLIVPNWQDGEMTPAKLQGSPGGPGADGVAAEYVLFHETSVIKIPDYLSYQEAAALPCAGLTAWNAIVEKSDLKPGNSVLILGTGGVSLFAMQFALMMGCEVIVTSSSDEKLKDVKKLGAHHTINYATNPNWVDEVLKLTDGAGVHHIAEVVGGSHLNISLQCIRSGGTIAQIGAIKGVCDGTVDTAEIMYKAVNIKGVEVGSKAMHARMLKAMEVHKTKPVIHKIFDFSNLAEAIDYQGSGTHFGKIGINL
ncbi:zinc-dependent alcohol dehydrogenase family protein [Kiloniella antarctica]|uniref:NAD(P)-dependent alcohol dehydrogenase n=1 Tax=Kiloniella antarctica TaxID=1550907 RepID=A0ABW5BIG1_9PROT